MTSEETGPNIIFIIKKIYLRVQIIRQVIRIQNGIFKITKNNIFVRIFFQLMKVLRITLENGRL